MKINKSTVSDLLWEVLSKLMAAKELNSFRLVGGTSLSLILGHRISIDIDLFTDEEYNSIDFDIIDKLFLVSFKYVKWVMVEIIAWGNLIMLEMMKMIL